MTLFLKFCRTAFLGIALTFGVATYLTLDTRLTPPIEPAIPHVCNESGEECFHRGFISYNSVSFEEARFLNAMRKREYERRYEEYKKASEEYKSNIREHGFKLLNRECLYSLITALISLSVCIGSHSALPNALKSERRRLREKQREKARIDAYMEEVAHRTYPQAPNDSDEGSTTTPHPPSFRTAKQKG